MAAIWKEDLSPIKYERVCQADGETVPWNEIVKGYATPTSIAKPKKRKSA